MIDANSMLLVLPVPFRMIDSQIHVEYQAHHGIRRWLDSFDHLVIAAPVIPESIALNRPEMAWLPVHELVPRVEFVKLPWAYRIDKYLLNLLKTSAVLNTLIDGCKYLQFAIGGVWGDWAAVGAMIAKRKKRAYSVHTDRVEHEVIRRIATADGRLHRLRVEIDSLLMKALHRRIINNCDLGLFHGMDTYDYYQKWMLAGNKADRAHCIHNIHDEALEASAHPTEEIALTAENTDNGGALSLFYAGRFDATKAPLQWLAVVDRLVQDRHGIHAVWVGDGTLREDFQTRVQALKLDLIVKTPGFIKDRAAVARHYRSADIFLFTHITPESPRCLLEALRFGIPIVGYESAFARDLIRLNGGGVLVPSGDVDALAKAVESILEDTDHLKKLKLNALKDGARFTSKAVFEERSHLIKSYT